jgi:tetratricopeptide (TPR) repeat protein
VTYASTVLDLAADIAPTVYSLHVGFSSIAQVYFELWERALQNPPQSADAEQYRKLAEKAIRMLRNFRNMVPIGQPYLAYYQGWHQWLNGRPQKAIQSWQKGLEAATKFNTLYEEGLLRARLADVLKDEPDQQQEHFERACQIFDEMGAARDLQALQIKAS